MIKGTLFDKTMAYIRQFFMLRYFFPDSQFVYIKNSKMTTNVLNTSVKLAEVIFEHFFIF